MKRAPLLILLLLVAAVAAFHVSGDSVYWKRRALSLLHSTATLPALYYEPTQLIEGSDQPAPPRVSPGQERLDPAALQAAADYAREQETIALVVTRHGHIVFEQYWRGASYETVVDGGAFNAAIAALMVGFAIDDRKIGLVTEPVGNYVESFRKGERNAVTLEHLLHMSSGLGSNRGGPDPWTPSSREHLLRDVRSHCLSNEPSIQPGIRRHMQVCDPQLLAHIVERATGQPYAAYVSEKLWKPIGAGDAWLMLDREGGTAHAGCCLRARVADWLRFAELFVSEGRFQGGEVVPPAWMRAMRTPDAGEKRFGYQVWLAGPFLEGGGASEPYAADDMLILRGNGQSRLWMVPSMGLTILRVGVNDDVDPDWDDSRIPNLIIRGAGDYVPKAPREGERDVSDLVPNH